MLIPRPLIGFFGLLLCLLATPLAAAPKITFWLSFQATELTDSLGKAFTRQTGIPLDIQYIEGSSFKAELIRAAFDEEAPEVVLFPADYLAIAKEVKFSVIPPSAQSKDVLAKAKQAGMQGNVVLGAPVYWGNHLLLYYNRDFVKTPAATFEELERQAPAFLARRIKPLGISFDEMYSFVPFLSAFGGWPLDENGKPTLNTPAMLQALNYYFGLERKGLLEKGCWGDCAPYEFADGKIAYYIGGDWKYRWFDKQLGSQLGVALLPKIGNRPLTSMFSSYVLAFPRNALDGPKREALLKFIAFMQSPAVQTRWAKEAKVLPVNENVFRGVTAKASKNQQAVLMQLQQSRVMPTHRNMAFAWEGMSKGFYAMENQRANAQQAAALMQKVTERAIKNTGD